MFRPLEAIVRSRFGYPGGGVKFKVANGTGRGRWSDEISFFQMHYVGTLANVVGKVGCNLKFTNLDTNHLNTQYTMLEGLYQRSFTD